MAEFGHDGPLQGGLGHLPEGCRAGGGGREAGAVGGLLMAHAPPQRGLGEARGDRLIPSLPLAVVLLHIDEKGHEQTLQS